MSSSDNSPSSSLSRFAIIAFVMLAINHLVGVIGLNIETSHQRFENLSALNLLLSFVLVLVFHQPVNRNLFLFCVISFITGMAAEIVGVNTGYPFGIYHYTHRLGPQVLGVPVIIGINWILLSYVTAIAAKRLFKGPRQIMIGASVMMVGIDLLLEGFAIRHHFWVWENPTPPLQNYLSWFAVSLLIQFAFQRLIPSSVNKNATRYLVILLLFLAADLFFAMVH